MLRRILLCLFALALLNASPAFHWHAQSHQARAAAAGETPDEGRDTHGACAECLLLAQQAAAVAPVLLPCFEAVPAGRGLAALACQPFAQALAAGAARARGPPGQAA